LTDSACDNYDACWLPDGDVVFLSNRDSQWALCFWSQMGVLYRMDRDGELQRRISANYLQDFTPKITSDGRLMFSRWEYVDRPVQPTKAIWTMNPDGSMMRGYFGNRVLSPKSFMNAQSIPGRREVLCTLSGHLGWVSGALGMVDPSRGDNAQAALVSLTPECSTGRVDEYRASADILGRYETPCPVDGEHYLFSYDGAVMLRNFAGTEEWLILPRQAGRGFYSARPLRARPRPPPGQFQLLLGDRPLLKFGVTQEEATWKGHGGKVTLRFTPVSEEAGGLDRTGIMELTLPASLLKPGRKARLRVVAPQSGSHRWFGKYHYSLGAGSNADSSARPNPFTLAIHACTRGCQSDSAS